MQTRTRLRVRVRERIQTQTKTQTASAIPPEVYALAIEAEKARLAANEANRLGSAAKKKLFALLDSKKLKEVSLMVKLAGKNAKVTVSKQGGETSVLNVKKFKSKVSPETFMKCIVVQKGLADKYAGNVLRMSCETTEECEPTWGIKTEFTS